MNILQQPGINATAESEITVLPTSEVAEEELTRICQHALFTSSPSLRRFLQFIVRKSIEGLTSDLKEYTIGVEALGRGESFDSRDSSIVRTQAFNLRTKLKAYYKTHGSDAPFQIKLQPGSYVPIFTSPPAGGLAATPVPSVNRSIRLDLGPINISQSADELGSRMGALHEALVIQLVQTGQFLVANVALTEGNRHDESRAQNADFRAESSAELSGGRIKIRMRLANQSAGGYFVWGRTFEWSEVAFNIEQVAHEIAMHLGQATGAVANRLPTATQNPQAQAAYQEGQSFLTRMNVADCRRAQRRFRRATQLDPLWAAAQSGLALAVVQGVMLEDTESVRRFVDAEIAAARALALGYGAPSSQLARGATLALFDWDLHGAAEYLRRAEQFQDQPFPDVLTCSFGALLNLLPQGRFPEAIERLQEAVSVYPSHMLARFALGTALRLARRYEDALAVFSASLEFDEQCGMAVVGIAQVFSNRRDSADEAFSALRQAEALIGRTAPAVGLEGYLAGSLGQHERAVRLEAELVSRAKPQINFFYERALIQMGLGHDGEGLLLLEQAIHVHEAAAFLGRFEPLWDGLRHSTSGARVFSLG